MEKIPEIIQTLIWNCQFLSPGRQFLKKMMMCLLLLIRKKVQVGKDQEKAQSEKDSHSKNRGGKKQTNNQVLIQ